MKPKLFIVFLEPNNQEPISLGVVEGTDIEKVREEICSKYNLDESKDIISINEIKD
jgi:hypothetical protein